MASPVLKKLLAMEILAVLIWMVLVLALGGYVWVRNESTVKEISELQTNRAAHLDTAAALRSELFDIAEKRNNAVDTARFVPGDLQNQHQEDSLTARLNSERSKLLELGVDLEHLKSKWWVGDQGWQFIKRFALVLLIVAFPVRWLVMASAWAIRTLCNK